MGLKTESDGFPKGGEKIVRVLNPAPERDNSGIRERQWLDAVALDHFVFYSNDGNQDIPNISKLFASDFAFIRRQMKRIQSLKTLRGLETSKLFNRITRGGSKGNWELWDRLHQIAELYVEGVRYDGHISAFFDALHRHGYMVDGKFDYLKHDKMLYTPERLANFDRLLKDLWVILNTRKFINSENGHYRECENKSSEMRSFVDWQRSKREWTHVLRFDLLEARESEEIARQFALPINPHGISSASSLPLIRHSMHNFKRFKNKLRGRKEFRSTNKAPGHGKLIFDYIWKLNFSIYNGYVYHFIFFFDADEVKDVGDFEVLLKQAWLDVAGEKGMAYSSKNSPNKYKSRGIGTFSSHDEGSWGRLYDSLEYLAHCDRLTVVKQEGRIHSFGHSEIPGLKGMASVLRQKPFSTSGPATLGGKSESAEHANLSGRQIFPDHRKGVTSNDGEVGNVPATDGHPIDLARIGESDEQWANLLKRAEDYAARKKNRSGRANSKNKGKRLADSGLTIGSHHAEAAVDLYQTDPAWKADEADEGVKENPESVLSNVAESTPSTPTVPPAGGGQSLDLSSASSSGNRIEEKDLSIRKSSPAVKTLPLDQTPQKSITSSDAKACVRYAVPDRPAIRDAFQPFTFDDVEFSRRLNVPPASLVPIILSGVSWTNLTSAHWGVAPSGRQGEFQPALTYIIPSEEVASLPTWGDSYRAQRCLMPALGWIAARESELIRDVDGRVVPQPYYLHATDDGLIAFAGLWIAWRDLTGEEMLSCALLTREVAHGVHAIHHRMPTVLAPTAFTEWLDPRTPVQRVSELIAASRQDFVGHRVSLRVYSPQWDESGLLDPVPPADEPHL